MFVCYILSRMCLRCRQLSYFHYFLWYMRSCMCSTDSYKFRWPRGYICNWSYHHNQIGNQPSTLLSYFSTVGWRRWQCHRMRSVSYISQKSLVLLLYTCVVLWCAKIIDYIRLFAHYSTSLSSLCRVIWKYWTARMFQIHSIRCMLAAITGH